MIRSVTQHRTQVYLPTHLYWKAKNIAHLHNLPLAGVIRKALETYSESEIPQKREDVQSARARFMKLAGMGKGPKDLAQHHDKYW